LVDGAHHFSRVLDISLVMEICEMNEPAATKTSLEIRHAEFGRVEPTIYRQRCRGQCQRAEAEKFSSCHRSHFLRDVRQA
jgi:hypothetical protein